MELGGGLQTGDREPKTASFALLNQSELLIYSIASAAVAAEKRSEQLPWM